MTRHRITEFCTELSVFYIISKFSIITILKNLINQSNDSNITRIKLYLGYVLTLTDMMQIQKSEIIYNSFNVLEMYSLLEEIKHRNYSLNYVIINIFIDSLTALTKATEGKCLNWIRDTESAEENAFKLITVFLQASSGLVHLCTNIRNRKRTNLTRFAVLKPKGLQTCNDGFSHLNTILNEV
jgi:hypothetical protein